MKAKHYPHVTAVAALLLLIAPALILLIPSAGSQSLDELIAEVDPPAQPSEVTTDSPSDLRPVTRVALAEPRGQAISLGTSDGADAQPAQRMHANTDQSPSSAGDSLDVDIAIAQPSLASQSSSSQSVYSPPKTTEAFVETEYSGSHTPPGRMERPLMEEGDAFSPVVESEYSIADGSESTDAGSTSDLTDEERNALLAQEMDEALASGSTTSKSHFESTGHLAMTTEPNRPPTATPRKPSRKKPTSRTRSRKREDDEASDEQEAAATKESATAMTPAGTLLPGDDQEDPFASQPRNPIVDVVIQQPFERRPVNKVENLVAMTQQPGWPIALVRSDIPDDVWWVQQMVGIHHRSFTSRVNFGNDSSLPGSVYKLVIVFLDSADEARRFRIAKQFKEIPEGLRRTREYTFVRK